MKKDANIYLDHAAGTSLLPEVVQVIKDFTDAGMMNPASIHYAGRSANTQLDQARRTMARALGVKPGEIVFTSGGTEANNMALLGLARSAKTRGKHILSCKTEHASALAALDTLAEEGFDVEYLETNASGQINIQDLEAKLRPDTILLSLMWVNNETGLIHDIEEISQLAARKDILLHCDGVQAIGHLEINLPELPLNTLSISGHKLGTPAGIGALYIKKGAALKPHMLGGSQENNLRGGTPNLLGALALARAVEVTTSSLEDRQKHFHGLKSHLTKGLQQIPELEINGKLERSADHILNCSIRHVDGEAMFIRLDMAGLAVSNGSACTSGSQAPSHVLTALGHEKSLAQASIRISMGMDTRKEEIEHFTSALTEIIDFIRKGS